MAAAKLSSLSGLQQLMCQYGLSAYRAQWLRKVIDWRGSDPEQGIGWGE